MAGERADEIGSEAGSAETAAADGKPASGRGFRDVLKRGVGRPKGSIRKAGRAVGKSARHVDERATADPAAISNRRGRGAPKLTADEKAARVARRAAEKELLAAALKAPPPEIPADEKSQLKTLLVFAHIGVAQLMAQPEIALSDAEADAYTKATAEFARWHMPSLQLGGKRGSEIALGVTLAMIYVPKALAIQARKRGIASGPIPVENPPERMAA